MERIVAFDVETPNCRNDRMCAIGLSVVEGLELVHSEAYLIDPQCGFDYRNVMIHGVTPDMVAGAPCFPELWERIAPLMRGSLLAAHNAVFDMGVLRKCLDAYGISAGPLRYVCTVRMSRAALRGLENHKLPTLCRHYGISLCHHNAASDADACAQILCNLVRDGAELERYIRQCDM